MSKRLIVIGLLLIGTACGKDSGTPDVSESKPPRPRTHVKIITEFTDAADEVSYEEVEINGRRCIEAFYSSPSIFCDPPTTTTTSYR